jgi:hypothetical protein
MSDFNSTDDQSWRDEPEAEQDDLECLDGNKGGCSGPVEYRFALSPSGRQFPRCDAHWAKRLDEQEEINRKYPALQPSNFDEMDAGERWYEDE